eukprot:3837178-Amphidinium_carterae.1
MVQLPVLQAFGGIGCRYLVDKENGALAYGYVHRALKSPYKRWGETCGDEDLCLTCFCSDSICLS